MNEKTKFSYATLNVLSFDALQIELGNQRKSVIEALELKSAPYDQDSSAVALIDIANRIAESIDSKRDDIDPIITAFNIMFSQLAVLAAIASHKSAVEHTRGITEKDYDELGVAGVTLLMLPRHMFEHETRCGHWAQLFELMSQNAYRTLTQQIAKAAKDEFTKIHGSDY
jgi:hypothetical protein